MKMLTNDRSVQPPVFDDYDKALRALAEFVVLCHACGRHVQWAALVSLGCDQWHPVASMRAVDLCDEFRTIAAQAWGNGRMLTAAALSLAHGLIGKRKTSRKKNERGIASNNIDDAAYYIVRDVVGKRGRLVALVERRLREADGEPVRFRPLTFPPVLDVQAVLYRADTEAPMHAAPPSAAEVAYYNPA